jgi:hypothetical protein
MQIEPARRPPLDDLRGPACRTQWLGVAPQDRDIDTLLAQA